MIVVMGATGNTGKAVAQGLLAAGNRIRVIGRSEERLKGFAARGAETAVGDVSEGPFLARAFRGAEAVYAMIPPDYREPDYLGRYDRIGAAIVEGLSGSGVGRVVFLSSLGAELPSGTGPIVGLHHQEERLKQLVPIDLLILRPGYFMENLLGNIGLVKEQGINGGVIAPDTRLAMVATRDIGAAAATALRARDSHGTSVRELLGQRDLTMREVTRVVGARIGKLELPYVQLPDDELTKALQQAGIARPLAESFVEMSRAINEGRIRSLEGRNPANTTPTSIEDFAAEFAQAYARA